MNAKELREELAEYDDDLKVVIENPHVEMAAIRGVEKGAHATYVEDESGDGEVVEEELLSIR